MKKTIALLLALFMLVALFAGCQKTETPDASEPVKSESEAISSEPSEAVSSEASEDVEDNSASVLPWTGDTITYHGFSGDLGVTEDTECYAFSVYKDIVGNVDIQWEQTGLDDYDTKLALYLNSGECPDIIFAKAAVINTYGDSGLFLDFKQYYDYMPNWTAMVAADSVKEECVARADGQVLGIPALTPDYVGDGWEYNVDVLNELGYTEAPTTLDDAFTVMAAARDAGYTGFVTYYHWGISYIEQAVGLCTRFRTYQMDKKDPYTKGSDWFWGFADENENAAMKDMVEAIHTMYTETYLHPDAMTMSSDDVTMLRFSGKWAFAYDYSGTVVTNERDGSNILLGRNETPDMITKAMTTPMKDGGTSWVECVYMSDYPAWNMMSSVTMEHPEVMAAMIDAMLGDEMSYAIQGGEEGVTYEWVDGEFTWLDSYLDADTDTRDAIKAEVFGKTGYPTILPRCIVNRMDQLSQKSQHYINVQWYQIQTGAILDGNAIPRDSARKPNLTEEESQEYAEIMTAVNTYIDENKTLFELDKRDMSEWDAFVEEAKAMGDWERAVEIYNNAEQSAPRTATANRNYVTP